MNQRTIRRFLRTTNGSSASPRFIAAVADSACRPNRKPFSAYPITLLLVVIAAFSGASVAQEPGGPTAEIGVSHVPYNFTPYTIEYRLGDNAGGQALLYRQSGGGANGGTIICCYQAPRSAKTLEISWRYITGPYEGTPSDVYHYKVTIPHPIRIPNATALTVRFYDKGRVAVRFTPKPEMSDFGNVGPDLPGTGWIESIGAPVQKSEQKGG